MSLKIIAVGKVKDSYLREGINEYIKRINPWQKTEITEVKESKAPEDLTESAVKEEGERILKKIRPGSYVIVLTPEGQQFSSEALAKQIEQVLLKGQSRIDIIIGGYAGLSPRVKQQADLLLSLSELTFSAQLTRLLIMEQLFRCMKIIKREPYHR